MWYRLVFRMRTVAGSFLALLLLTAPLLGVGGCDDVVDAGTGAEETVAARIVDGEDGRPVAGADVRAGHYRRSTADAVLCALFVGDCPAPFNEDSATRSDGDGAFRLRYERGRATHLVITPPVDPATHRHIYYGMAVPLDDLSGVIALQRIERAVD